MSELTIVIPYIKDWDGLIMTVMSIKLYHKPALHRLKVLIIDNDLIGGPHSNNAEKLAEQSGDLDTTYMRLQQPQGVSVAKNYGIANTTTTAFICCDSHVMFPEGVLAYILDFFKANPDTKNLYQGPLLDNTLTAYKGTEMLRIWDNQMLGKWVVNEQVYEGKQYEIDMHGMGFFCGVTKYWPGFHPLNRGFGCEAGYIHDVYRQRGDKCILDPKMLWWHRTGYVNGPPYVNIIDNRIYNYLLAAKHANTVTPESVEDYYVNDLKLITKTRFDEISKLVDRGKLL